MELAKSTASTKFPPSLTAALGEPSSSPEHERQVGGEREEAGEPHRGAAEPEGVRRGPQREHEGDPPQRHVEARERVVGMDARPARRGGPHQVAAHVVTHRDTGQAGDLRRVGGDELPRDAHVQGRVDVLAHVEPESTLGVHAVRAVLRRRQHRDQHGDGRQRAPQRRPILGEPEPGPQQHGVAEKDERREQRRDAAHEAQPVGAAAEQQARWNDERGVDPNADEPLEGDPRAENRREREEREASRGEERIAAVGQEGLLRSRAAWVPA